MLITKVPLRDPEGKMFGLVGATRDITERKRAEEDLRRAYEELEQNQRILNQTLKEPEASHSELSAIRLQLILVLTARVTTRCGCCLIKGEWHRERVAGSKTA